MSIKMNEEVNLTELERRGRAKDSIKVLYWEILREIGLDLEDPNLKETPQRIARMYVDEIFNPEEPKCTVFPNEEKYDQIVIDKNIPFYSMCSHHFLPFFGTASIGYIPEKQLLGLSKLDRIVDYYAKRPQLQERMTQQIAKYIEKKVKPKGVAVVITARHLCKEMRGIKKSNAEMVTSEMLGAFRKNKETRNEFMELIKE